MDIFTQILNAADRGPSSIDPEWNKFFTKLRKKIDSKNEIKTCFLCNQKARIVDSHTIPHFILDNIAENGMLKNTQIFNNKFLLSDKNGLNKIQTFRLICSECDGQIFQEYEKENIYLHEPNQLTLKEIALKNHLSRLYKHTQEKIMACNALCEIKSLNISQIFWLKNFFEIQRTSAIKGITYNEKEAKTIYSHIKNNDKIYEICYFRILNYTVPYALQGNTCIWYGFNGEQLIYPFIDSSKKIKDLHICIFPFNSKSVILIFCKKEFDKYFKFFKKLKSHSIEEQLSIINYFCFAYFEDIFLNSSQCDKLSNNQALKDVSMTQPSVMTFYNGNNSKKNILREQIKQFKKKFSIARHSDIPNLLNKDFEVK